MEALADDLNTPEALAEFNRVARELAKAENQEQAQERAGELLADGELIGLLLTSPDTWFGSDEGNPENEAIEALIGQRNQARADKDFATADAIRDRLTAMGIVLEDVDGTTRWRKTDT
jgi:cysteinyl-tRNA synthetase